MDANESGQERGTDSAQCPEISGCFSLTRMGLVSAGPFQDEDGNFGLVCSVPLEIRLLDWEALML